MMRTIVAGGRYAVALIAFAAAAVASPAAMGRDAPFIERSPCAALSQAAEAGSAGASARLGIALLDGACGDDGDPDRATELLETAAERGHPVAAWRLALHLEARGGDGGPDGRAARFYRMAAEAGHPGAQHRLGLLLVAHGADPETRAKGLGWLRDAAHHGHGLSAATLALIHARGMHGVARDPCRALAWIGASERLGAPVDLGSLAATLAQDAGGAC